MGGHPGNSEDHRTKCIRNIRTSVPSISALQQDAVCHYLRRNSLPIRPSVCDRGSDVVSSASPCWGVLIFFLLKIYKCCRSHSCDLCYSCNNIPAYLTLLVLIQARQKKNTYLLDEKLPDVEMALTHTHKINHQSCTKLRQKPGMIVYVQQRKTRVLNKLRLARILISPSIQKFQTKFI